MLSWKRLLLGISLPVIVYLFSPIKEHIVDHYALRWYVQQNSSDRSVRIRVHNLSSNVSLPITIEVENPGAKVIDFNYADPWDGPQVSSLGTARHSEILRQYDLSAKSHILLDEHLVTSTLDDIEDQLEDAILIRTVPREHKRFRKEEMTLQNHLLWLEQCRRAQSPAAHPCCMERAWENWEYMLRGIQGEEAAFWKQITGVELGFQDFHIVPQNRMRYVVQLAAGHSVLFVQHYGPDPMNGKVDVFTSDGPALRMNKEKDLDRPIWIVLFQYPLIDPVYGLLVALLVIATLPWWAPLKFLNTFTIVNQALSKSDQMDTTKEWEEVYGRMKFSLKDKFDYFRSLLGRSQQQLGPDELFDYLRGYLRLVYRSGVGRFGNNRQLEATINRCLLELASK